MARAAQIKMQAPINPTIPWLINVAEAVIPTSPSRKFARIAPTIPKITFIKRPVLAFMIELASHPANPPTMMAEIHPNPCMLRTSSSYRSKAYHAASRRQPKKALT
jgi:hypothetical protein